MSAAATVASRGRARIHVSRRVGIPLARVAIVAIVLLAWEYVPQISWLRSRSPVFDPFFVSSPSQIAERLYELTFGVGGSETLWPYLWQTLQGTLLGVAIGTVAGALAGLVFSNSPLISKTLQPFITMMNATPRIALIPIFVIIAGPSITATVLTAILVVFFLVFYNAFSGGMSVAPHALQNARLLGATSWEVMRHVRLPYVLVWTFASLPNAVSFGLISVVTAEILTGALGLGRLLSISIQTVDSTLTFSVVVILTVLGMVLVTITDRIRNRVLHWWTAGSAD